MYFPYNVGEIRMTGSQRIPSLWHLCDGSSLAIASYPALYALIGTSYGGDGVTSFNLPDLRGQVVVHRGQVKGMTPRSPGQTGGSATVTLTATNMPKHTHTVYAVAAAGTATSPDGAMLAGPSDGSSLYVPGTVGGSLAPLQSGTIGPEAGVGQPHDNMMPSLAINYIIALQATPPSATAS